MVRNTKNSNKPPVSPPPSPGNQPTGSTFPPHPGEEENTNSSFQNILKNFFKPKKSSSDTAYMPIPPNSVSDTLIIAGVNDPSLGQPPVLPTLTTRDHQPQMQSIDETPSNTRPENQSSLQLTPENFSDMTPLVLATQNIIASLDRNYYRLTSPNISPSNSDQDQDQDDPVCGISPGLQAISLPTPASGTVSNMVQPSPGPQAISLLLPPISPNNTVLSGFTQPSTFTPANTFG